jgi:hypothetical protein
VKSLSTQVDLTFQPFYGYGDESLCGSVKFHPLEIVPACLSFEAQQKSENRIIIAMIPQIKLTKKQSKSKNWILRKVFRFILFSY